MIRDRSKANSPPILNIRILTTRVLFEEKTMKRISLIIGLAALVLVAALVGTSMITAVVVADDDNDDDNRVFTNKSIKGRWGFSAQGTILPPFAPALTPASAVGTLDFDGSGGCSITDTENIGGIVIPFRTTDDGDCMYSVNPDGTGTLSFAFPGDPGPGLVSFVILNKNEVRDMRADSLAVATGVWKR